MKMLTALLLAATITTAVTAQPAPSMGPAEYTLRLSAEDVNAIGAGINELPAKFANPLTQRIIPQIESQKEAFRKANEPKPATPAGTTEPPK